ncbi:MAG: TIGR04211 family SH3 domain-containing protein [Gammaproteobacteria bacterium]|nr:TIGR04211 family SH3 domain-containing protein [Gammaproteobacteria bacterium]
MKVTNYVLNMTIQKYKNSSLDFFIPRYFISTIISLVILSCAANASAAEYVYISDNLRVGVRKEPVSGVPPIGVVFTGMRLEVHEKVDGYVKITTDKGVQGWIKDIYVTKKAPAIIQLNEFRAKYDKLKKELSQGSDTSAVLEKANLTLNDQIDELKAERREWSRERASLMASQYKKSSWFWIIEVIVLISVSFGAGVLWYKTHVMKRLGGLRV